MSFSIQHSEGSVPVAKIRDSKKIVYFTPKNCGLSHEIKNSKTDPKLCIYCKKKYARDYNLKVHQKTCKKKKEEDEKGENGQHSHLDFSEKDEKGYGRLINIPVFSVEEEREKNRDVVYICGKNGSGKSYYASEYIKLYHKLYPDDNIILITRLIEDTTMDNMGVEDYVERIVVSDDILNNKYELEKFEHALVVFDDIDSSKNSKKLKKYLHALRDDLIENGRHLKINMLITSHQITNYKDTRTLLDECSSLVIFPNMNIPYQIERVLKSYYSMSNSQRQKIFGLNSRWVAINNKFQFITHQHGIYMLSYV
jgi:hypothetical protein